MTTERAPTKKKVKKIEGIKKPLMISGIIAAFAVAGIIVGINIKTTQPKILYFCGYGLPYTIDPIDVSDPVDADVINQVAEGLFDIDENSEIINCLATHHEWSTDDLNLTCTLRQGVKFHDGTPFNATAVKWNIDRAYRLIDNVYFSFLWKLPDNRSIINETQVIDQYTVKFILNSPYSPLLSLLASTYSYIVSPTSTPADDFIVPPKALVGTGPFIFDHFGNLTLSANQYYWGGKPKVDKLIFLQISDELVEDALLSGEIHIKKSAGFNESILDSFRNNPSFKVTDGIPVPWVDFIVMNNKLINITMRKAISYAFNYSSYQYHHTFVRAKSPIPEGILYYNISGINVPYYNITIARQTLKDGNWPGTELLTVNNNISAGNEWELVADSPTPLATYTYSACYQWLRSIWYSDRIVEDLRQIGVKVLPTIISFAEWLRRSEDIDGDHRDEVELDYNFWLADYNDPSNFINEFYTNKKIGYNMGQVNDTQVQEWMEEAVIETDPNARRQLYYDIQKCLIEVVFPHVWLNSRTRIDIYISKLIGWHPHPIKDSFKNVSFV